MFFYNLTRVWWNGRHSRFKPCRYGMGVQVPPLAPRPGDGMAYVLVSETRFCGFKSRSGHHFQKEVRKAAVLIGLENRDAPGMGRGGWIPSASAIFKGSVNSPDCNPGVFKQSSWLTSGSTPPEPTISRIVKPSVGLTAAGC